MAIRDLLTRRHDDAPPFDEPLDPALDDVSEFAEALPEEFLACRELGHHWQPWAAGLHPDGGFDRTLRCSRCHTEKHQELSNRGSVLTSRYNHPDGYLTKGLGRITGDGRGVLRLEAIRRLMNSDFNHHDDHQHDQHDIHHDVAS